MTIRLRLITALLLAYLLPVQSFGATYYVLAGGAGTHSGADWTNANCKIPTLAAGDVVYIGNSGGNLADTTTGCAGEAVHTFSTSGTNGSHITIKAATGADHGTATGWSGSFGVDVTPKITWSNAKVPSDGLVSPFWSFCPGSYYDVNGQVGSSDQTGTYGFYFKSAGRMFGFIKVDSHDCSEANVSNLTFQNVEIDGVEANSTNGGTSSGGNAIYVGSPVSKTATVQSISFSNVFIHDVFGPFSSAGNVTGLTLANSWIYTNFSDAAQHSNAIDTQAPSNDATQVGLSNLIVYDTVFKNIQGTAALICLNGQCTGWQVYNNIFYFTSDWDSICEHGDATATCGISKLIGDNTPTGNLSTSVIYGNSISGIHLKPGHAGADESGIRITISGSSGNDAQNNLWWNSTLATITNDAKLTNTYNRWLNTSAGTTTLGTGDFATASGAVNPFVGTTDFHLVSETVDTHLNDGNTLSAPYNLDYAGVTRGADGTWERGAYEFTLTGGGSSLGGNLTMGGSSAHN